MEPNDDGGCFYIEGGGGRVSKFSTRFLCVGYVGKERTNGTNGTNALGAPNTRTQACPNTRTKEH